MNADLRHRAWQSAREAGVSSGTCDHVHHAVRVAQEIIAAAEAGNVQQLIELARGIER